MATLRTHLLVPRGDGHSVLTVDGTLPVLDLAIGREETVVVALRRQLAADWSLDGVVLETHLRPLDASVHTADAPVHAGDEDDAYVALGVLEPPEPSWTPPAGIRWDSPPATLPDFVGARASTWLAELTGTAEPDPLRPPWSRSGWQRRAEAWIRDSLDAIDRPAAGPAEVRRLWGISALERVPTADGGTAWFKAVFAPFRHEVAVTRLLASAVPDAVPRVLASDDERGWLLLDDVPGGPLGWEASQETAEAAIRKLVEIQAAMRGREAEILATGAPHRPLAKLADDVERAMADPAEVEGPEVDRAELHAVLEWIGRQAAWLAGTGVPETLIHGDFHVWNALAAADSPVLIDWSDAAISHPLLEIGPWFGHPGAPGDADHYWHAWLDALSAIGPVEEVRGRRDTVFGLAAAYQLVSYAGIVRNLEPATRHQLSDGVRDFWSLLKRAALGEPESGATVG